MQLPDNDEDEDLDGSGGGGNDRDRGDREHASDQGDRAGEVVLDLGGGEGGESDGSLPSIEDTPRAASASTSRPGKTI